MYLLQDKRGQRIESKRKEQKEFMKGIVQRVLEEFTKAGKLGEDELDDAAKAVLEKMEAKVSGAGVSRSWSRCGSLSLTAALALGYRVYACNSSLDAASSPSCAGSPFFLGKVKRKPDVLCTAYNERGSAFKLIALHMNDDGELECPNSLSLLYRGLKAAIPSPVSSLIRELPSTRDYSYQLYI